MQYQKIRFPDGIIFDCDSTLSAIEGIDELAALKNCREQITQLTNQAMNGQVPLEKVYSKRLEIIKPHKNDLEVIANLYCEKIVHNANLLIENLRNKNIKICIISGGLREAILPLADLLNIEHESVFAVDLAFDEQGNFLKVIDSPLTTANGKKEVARNWKQSLNLQKVYIIGDGASDAAAKDDGAADLFIGFGGVIARENIRKQADIFLESSDLSDLFDLFE